MGIQESLKAIAATEDPQGPVAQLLQEQLGLPLTGISSHPIPLADVLKEHHKPRFSQGMDRAYVLGVVGDDLLDDPDAQAHEGIAYFLLDAPGATWSEDPGATRREPSSVLSTPTMEGRTACGHRSTVPRCTPPGIAWGSGWGFHSTGA